MTAGVRALCHSWVIEMSLITNKTESILMLLVGCTRDDVAAGQHEMTNTTFVDCHLT